MKFPLYVHIPFCVSKCAYCDFFSAANPTVPDEYIDALLREAEAKVARLGVESWKSVYVGGGTPSLLNARQIERLFSGLLKINNFSADGEKINNFCADDKSHNADNFRADSNSCNEINNFRADNNFHADGKSRDNNSRNVASNIEITVEANPCDITETFLAALADSGVTRLSCGIQSFNEKCLSVSRRRSSVRDNERALSLLQKNWRGSLSIDVISGLPGETEDSLLAGLRKILFYEPAHVSLYALTLEERTPLGDEVFGGRRPYDFDFADSLWISGRDFLTKNGYAQYEISNFCLPGNECVHNLAYWNLESYVGIGAGAVGTIYGKDESRRVTNTHDIRTYIDFWKSKQVDDNNPRDVSAAIEPIETIETIDKKTEAFEFFMMGLRTAAGISRETYQTKFGDFPEKARLLFDEWQKKGLAKVAGERYSLTPRGMLFLNEFLKALI